MFSEQLIAEIMAIKNQFPLMDLGRIEILCMNLALIHQVIIASERLLEEAAQEADGELKKYYIAHLEEERGHAAWLEDDLKCAGIDVKDIPLHSITVAMAGSQYYLMKHVHPAALLGYMLVLEGLHADLSHVEKMEQMHGKEVLRTLNFHAIHDVDHKKDLFVMIDKSEHQDLIRLNAIQTANYLNGLSRDINNLQKVT